MEGLFYFIGYISISLLVWFICRTITIRINKKRIDDGTELFITFGAVLWPILIIALPLTFIVMKLMKLSDKLGGV